MALFSNSSVQFAEVQYVRVPAPTLTAKLGITRMMGQSKPDNWHNLTPAQIETTPSAWTRPKSKYNAESIDRRAFFELSKLIVVAFIQKQC